MTTSYVDQLSAALVEQKGAEPATAALLAQLVIDGAAGGSIPDAIEAARTGFPNLFRPKAPQPTSAPEAETVTARVARLHREAESRGDAPMSHMPVTMRVLREARGGE